MMLKVNSWIIMSKEVGIKAVDKSALIHNGTGIPKKIRFFFEIENMEQGENRDITLFYNEKKYKARFNMESIKPARTRMFWDSEFKEVLANEFKDEYERIVSGQDLDLHNKPFIHYEKINKDRYIVTLVHGIKTDKVKEEDNPDLYKFSTVDILSIVYREFQEKVSKAYKDSKSQRIERLKKAPKIPRVENVVTKVYRRNPDVVAEVLYRAEGTCERCGSPAPFVRASDGTPYLEVHHRKRLAAGGEDTVKNAMATCPNCHRELHYGVLPY